LKYKTAKCQINGFSSYYLCDFSVSRREARDRESLGRRFRQTTKIRGPQPDWSSFEIYCHYSIQPNWAWHSYRTLHSRTDTTVSPKAWQVRFTSTCLNILSPAKSKSLVVLKGWAISKFRLLSEALNQGQHVSQAALSLFACMMV
jgi:hypothetical protein